MRRFLFALLGWLLLHASAHAQTAADPNEGSRLISLGNSNYQFNWWARAGVYYLVDVSEDLYSWNYLNAVFVGFGGVSAPVYFNSVAGNRMFVRLNTDPFNTDADGDGIPDGWEVLHGLNARFAGDASLDPDGDGFTNLEEYALSLDPHVNEYGTGQRTQIYTYDNATRLTNLNSSLAETFTYDAEGNLTNSQ
jgi:hypothetical protein